ncbi:MAG: TetR family transcriptional regulator [Oscillospiraceae bacterium]|nr:TetR family transcriptional regulator [Oscillospiraceae bacterium]
MKNKTDTKRSLIDATKTLLRENEVFTVKEISQRAFTNVAAINYHFGDKNSLIIAAMDELLEEFKQEIITRFSREFETAESALEDALQFLLETYYKYKGAIKYILLFDNPDLQPRLVESFFLGSEFTAAFAQRISDITGETDADRLFYRLSVTVSALLLPLLIEGKDSSGQDKLSLTALQEPENKNAFISVVMKLFQ